MIPISKPYIDHLEKKYLIDCVETNWISSIGKYIPKFEKMNSEYYDTNYAVAVSNGTVALHLALETLGIGEGDEVIVPNFTFAATVNAVIHSGATPVLAEIRSDNWTIDIKKCEELVSEKTKAIIPVHLYGHSCDLETLLHFADKYNLNVIEDCAEAHGAMYKGKKIGSFGVISCFSFYANKNLTTGEGGICLTNDLKLFEKMQVLRDHGMNKSKRYFHELVGFNYRMTNMQAAIGCAQMEKIDFLLSEREKIMNIYNSFLSEYVKLPTTLKDTKSVCWLYSILLPDEVDRNEIIHKLSELGIESRPLFFPLNTMPPYSNFKLNENKIAKNISSRGINLPTFVGITEKEIEFISKSLLGILGKK